MLLLSAAFLRVIYFLFAHASGNLNPLNIPLPAEQEVEDNEAVAPSMWVGSLISSVLGNILPGPGTLYRSQDFNFLNYAHVGDLLRVEVKLIEKKNVRKSYLKRMFISKMESASQVDWQWSTHQQARFI